MHLGVLRRRVWPGPADRLRFAYLEPEVPGTAAGVPGPQDGATHQAFLLEDAEQIVHAAFGQCQVTIFEDGLEVTDTDALVAYVESFATLDPKRRCAVRNETTSRMKDGCLHITKVAGW